MRRPDRATVLGWAVLVVVGAAVSALLALLSLPSPVLFGSLVGGMVTALTRSDRHRPLHLPGWAFSGGQAIVGVTIGALVSLPTLRTFASDWLPILGVSVGTLLVSLAAGQGLRLHRGVSATTGAFAMVAGGASGITALSRELGADDRVVTVVQYLRVLLVLLAMPVVTAVVFHPSGGAGSAQTTGGGLWAALAFCAVSVAGGLLLARLTHLPAGSLLGPVVVAVVLSVTGVLGDVTVPAALQDVGYALIGVQVGLRFTRESLRSIAAMLPLAVLLIALVIAACAGLGLLLTLVTDVTPLDAYLATTPGGLYAVLATAVDSGSQVTFVLAVQVVRLLVVLFTAPLVGRLLR